MNPAVLVLDHVGQQPEIIHTIMHVRQCPGRNFLTRRSIVPYVYTEYLSIIIVYCSSQVLLLATHRMCTCGHLNVEGEKGEKSTS